MPNVYTKEELFEHITGLNADVHTTAMLERIHTKGASVIQATVPSMEECPDALKPLEYPFDVAWEKSQVERDAVAAANTAVLSVPNAIDDVLTPIIEGAKN